MVVYGGHVAFVPSFILSAVKVRERACSCVINHGKLCKDRYEMKREREKSWEDLKVYTQSRPYVQSILFLFLLLPSSVTRFQET